jgi:hypothetical protein
MENVVATFTTVHPDFAPVTADIGYAYEITVNNQSANPIVADSFFTDMNFGFFHHPAQNSVFVYSINAGAPENAFALATLYEQSGFTTPNIPDQVKLLLPGQALVLRLLTPSRYDDFVVQIENSIVITAN